MKRTLILVNLIFILSALSGRLYAQPQSISVTNKTGMAVSSVYISASGQDSWHMIRSTRNGITKDETFTFRQSAFKVWCKFDLKFRCEDGNYYYMRDLDMCTESSFMLTLPEK